VDLDEDDCDNNETQHNAISVYQPCGPTTIFVNSNKPVSEVSDVSSLSEASRSAVTGKALFDLATSPNHPPCQSVVRYPSTTIEGKQHPFNAEWYKMYSWLEYSVKRDTCFCYPCRLFTCAEGRSQYMLTDTGFRDWKHVTGMGRMLTVHDSSK